MSADPIKSRVQFCSDVRVLSDWAGRTGLPLPTSAAALSNNYTRAHNWLLQLKFQLISKFKWRDAPNGDARLLMSLCAPGGDCSLVLPHAASSFFSPDRLQAFVAQTATFTLCRHNVPPIADILFLLQCLIPGLLTIDLTETVPGQGNFTTSRGLPPVEWVDANRDNLLAIFGTQDYTLLRNAAATKTAAFHVTCSK